VTTLRCAGDIRLELYFSIDNEGVTVLRKVKTLTITGGKNMEAHLISALTQTIQILLCSHNSKHLSTAPMHPSLRLKSRLELVAALVHDGAVLETGAGRVRPSIGSTRAGLPRVHHPHHYAIRPVNGADATAS
jgi:hypothetical protein